MDIIRKLLAVALWVLAAVVGVHFVFTPVYDHVLNIGQAWEILGWFMIVGIVAVLVVQCTRKRGSGSHLDDAPVGREDLAASVAFYASVLLAIWFLWNLIDSIAIGTGSQDDNHLLIWAFIHPLFIMVLGATGGYLWSKAKE